MRKMQKRSEEIKDSFDLDSERAVLAAVLKYQTEIFYEIAAFINESSFYFPEHKLIWSSIKKIYEEKNLSHVDTVTLLSSIKDIDPRVISEYEIPALLDECNKIQLTLETGIDFSKRVARYALMRDLHLRLSDAIHDLKTTPADRPILDIFAGVEKKVFGFQHTLMQNESDTIQIGRSLETWYDKYNSDEPINRGIPTGYPQFDEAIGGGIRAPGVAVIGARPKTGKTAMALNIAKNATALGIPVLYLDTEMTYDVMLTKLIANLSSIEIKEIETGSFRKDIFKSNAVKDAMKTVKSSLFFYKNISGYSHNQTISVIRQWINRSVGFENGQVKPCLVVLDYIKVMDLNELGDHQEYQYLGQYLTDLHNFAVLYNLPIVAMVQLNRDGIETEGSKAVAGSDRIIWLCTSFSILKKKTPDDCVADPLTNGDRKLIVCEARYGTGMGFGEYINIKTDLGKCQMVEGITMTQVRASRGSTGGGGKSSTKGNGSNDNDSSPNNDPSFDL